MYIDPGKCRKAFHFGLDYHALCDEFGPKNTAAAYRKVKSFLTAHGFDKPQYSGYISNKPMTDTEFFQVYDSMRESYPWFERCAQKAHVSVILDSYDLLGFGSQGEGDIEPTEPDRESPNEVRERTFDTVKNDHSKEPRASSRDASDIDH